MLTDSRFEVRMDRLFVVSVIVRLSWILRYFKGFLPLLFLFSLLSTAEAEPIKGFRVNACVGIASHCPIGQVGFAYNAKRFAIDAGGFGPFPVGAHAGLQVYPCPK